MAINKVLLNKVNLLAEMDNLTETISNYDNIEYTTTHVKHMKLQCPDHLYINNREQ